jgi:two-component system cell cycle sensor histidine kinase/response regulator CckA
MQGNVLLAEDSATQAEALRAILEDAGHNVRVAGSGEEALAALERGDFDIVISDVVMPGMSGYDLCRRIKSSPNGHRIPVLLLTSLTDPMAIVRGLECGADNYVTKPYTTEYLLARVRHTLDKHTLREDPKTSMGVNVRFLDTRFTITSDKEQILDLFISSIEDVVRTNEALQASQCELAEAQRKLEAFAGRMEHEAQVTAEKYSALMHSAHDGIFVLDSAGRITESNARATELLGRDAADLHGRTLDELATAESRGALRERLETLTRTGRVAVSNVEFDHPVSGRIYGDVSASRTETKDGDLTLAILHDVTERWQAEERLRRSELELRQAQKMEAIGQLAGGIAHDFNNLLTVMRSYSELALAALEPASPMHEDIEEIRRAAESAAGLTAQLLAFSRKQVMQPRPIRLHDVAAGVERMLRRLIGENIELVLTRTKDDGLVFADAGQIEQVLVNLVVNARDAMPQGGRLTIATSVVHVSPADTRQTLDLGPGVYEVLSVADTGKGMDAETLEHIFEPFFTTKPQGQGTGLGLSTVYGIVKQSGGEIAVSSEPGKGTTCTIFLPRLVSDVGLKRSAPEAPNPRRGSETILLVEDEESVRRIARRVLTGSGYTVIEATNGEEAVAVCQSAGRPIDLVLTDVVMPGISAQEMVERLSAICRNVKVVFMSGYTDDDVMRRGLADPRTAFLQKPFTPASLAAKVREVLERGDLGEA